MSAPLTPNEIREMHSEGATVHQIAAKARRLNKMSIADVRAIIFGEDTAS